MTDRLRTVAFAWTIARADGVTIGLTDHDRDLEIDGLVHRAAPGMTPSAVARGDGLEADTMAVAGALTAAAIGERDLLAGRWDGARVRLRAIDWATGATLAELGGGTIGAVELSDGGFSAELRGAAAALDAPVAEETSPLCRAALGDRRCRVAMAGRRRFARVVGAPDRAIGATVIHALELPNLDETLLTQPRVLIAAAGTGAGWRRAALLTSLDDGATWTGAGATALPAVMGTVVVPPGDGSASVLDLANAIEVELLHADLTLASVDAAALDAGANLAVVGGEPMQFGAAAQLSPTRWRLTRLLRARRGVAAAHVAGEAFTLLAAECVTAVTLPLSAIGKTLRVLASGVGDGGSPAEAAVAVTGASVAPPAPVRLTATALADGATRVAWIRRSRLGWAWRDGGDAPLGEEREAYRVTIVAGSATRSLVVTAPEAIATAAETAAAALVSVRQLGTIAESRAAWITLG